MASDMADSYDSIGGRLTMDASSSNRRLIAELDEILGWAIIAIPLIAALAFFPLSYDFFGLPKLTAIYLSSIFLLYFQMRRWSAGGRIEIPISSALLPVAAVLIVAAVSVAVSEMPLASITGRFNRYNTLPALLCFALVLWFALKSAINRHVFTERFEALFVVVVFIISVYGLLEALSLDILGSQMAEGPRVSSTLGNPVFFGGFLAIALPFFLAKALMFTEKTGRVLRGREVAAALVVFGLVMLFITLSRGAWLGAGAGFAVVIYYWVRSGQRLKMTAVAFAGLLLIAVLIGTSLFGVIAGSSVDGIFGMANSSNSFESRIEIWKTSLLMIEDKPLSGFGLDQTKDRFALYMTEGLAKLENKLHGRAHNIFFQICLDGGLPFLLAYLWLFLYVILKGFRHLRRNPGDYVVAGLLGSLFGFFGQGLTGIATLDQEVFIWFIMGVLVGIVSEGRQRNLSLRFAAGKPFETTSGILAVALALIVIFPLVAEARYRTFAEDANSSMGPGALERAHHAGQYLILQPYHQSHLTHLYLEFAAAREDPAFARSAAKIAERGLRYAPEASELSLSLGDAYLAVAKLTRDRADIEKAQSYLKLASQRTPHMLTHHENLLELYLLKGDYRAVLKEAEIVDSLEGRSALTHVARSLAYEAQGDSAGAKKAYKEALALYPNAARVRAWLVSLMVDKERVKKDKQ